MNVNTYNDFTVIKRKPIGVELVGLFHQYLNFSRIKDIAGIFAVALSSKAMEIQGKSNKKNLSLNKLYFLLV